MPQRNARIVLGLLLLTACSQEKGGASTSTGGAGGEEGGSSGGRSAETAGSGGKGDVAGAGGMSGTSGVPGTAGVAGSTAGIGGGGSGSTPDGGPRDGSPGGQSDGGDAGTSSDGPANTASFCPPGPFEAPKAGPSKSICPGFTVKYNWSEGPTWVASQKAFFFSNFTIMQAGPGDMIKYDPATDKCEVFIEGNGCNGLTVDYQGNLLAACQGPRALLKYDLTTKKSTVLVDMVEGMKLDSPNDVVAHPNGSIYFSNTTFELGGRPQGLGSALLRLDPMGMVHIVAKGGINPLGLSPDQKRLYAMGGYWELDAAGLPGKKVGPFTLGNDGIAIDCAGNVYTNGGAIISPENKQVGTFAAGTNMAFGGEDRKTLLVVGGRNMHIHQMNLPGLP